MQVIANVRQGVAHANIRWELLMQIIANIQYGVAYADNCQYPVWSGLCR